MMRRPQVKPDEWKEDREGDKTCERPISRGAVRNSRDGFSPAQTPMVQIDLTQCKTKLHAISQSSSLMGHHQRA
eukprot:9933598-Ditylum_brightwellii.AAC.1